MPKSKEGLQKEVVLEVDYQPDLSVVMESFRPRFSMTTLTSSSFPDQGKGKEQRIVTEFPAGDKSLQKLLIQIEKKYGKADPHEFADFRTTLTYMTKFMERVKQEPYLNLCTLFKADGKMYLARCFMFWDGMNQTNHHVRFEILKVFDLPGYRTKMSDVFLLVPAIGEPQFSPRPPQKTIQHPFHKNMKVRRSSLQVTWWHESQIVNADSEFVHTIRRQQYLIRSSAPVTGPANICYFAKAKNPGKGKQEVVETWFTNQHDLNFNDLLIYVYHRLGLEGEHWLFADIHTFWSYALENLSRLKRYPLATIVDCKSGRAIVRLEWEKETKNFHYSIRPFYEEDWKDSLPANYHFLTMKKDEFV